MQRPITTYPQTNTQFKSLSSNTTYFTKQLIGQNTFGNIYRAECSEGKLFTLIASHHGKINYKQGQIIQDHFNSDLKSLFYINHPRIAKFNEAFYSQQQSQFVIIIEYCQGGPLDQMIFNSEFKPLTQNELKDIIAQVIEALHNLQSYQIPLTRNLDLTKIFVSEDGNIKLFDFDYFECIKEILQVKNDSEKAKLLEKRLSQQSQIDSQQLGVFLYQLLLKKQINIDQNTQNFIESILENLKELNLAQNAEGEAILGLLNTKIDIKQAAELLKLQVNWDIIKLNNPDNSQQKEHAKSDLESENKELKNYINTLQKQILGEVEELRGKVNNLQDQNKDLVEKNKNYAQELKIKEEEEAKKNYDPNMDEFYQSITINNKNISLAEANQIPKETITTVKINSSNQIKQFDPITDFYFHAIAKFLVGIANLECLQIDTFEANLTDQALTLITKPLSQLTKLKDFRIYVGGNQSKSVFTDIGFGNICMALSNATNLQSFCFECTGFLSPHSLTDSSLQHLAYTVNQFAENLKVFRLFMTSMSNKCSITDKGLLHLGKALSKTTQLTDAVIRLTGYESENQTTDIGFMAIIDGLSNNTSLQKLDFIIGGENCSHSITDKSFIHLSEKFSGLFNLNTLVLGLSGNKGQNQITDAGLKAYSNLLKHNRDLIYITLKFGGKNSKNKITDEGIIELCSAIDETKIKLERGALEFDGHNCENHITDKGFEQFAKLIYKVDANARTFSFMFQGDNCKHQITEKSAGIVQKALENAKGDWSRVQANFSFGGFNTNNNDEEIQKVLKQQIVEFGKKIQEDD